MDSYLRDAATVFKEFQDRVSIVWKNPDARPLSDLLRITLKTPGSSSVEIIDKSQNLTETERAFLFSLYDALQHLEQLLGKALDGVKRILATFDKDLSEGTTRGVLTGASSWKPFNEKNRVAVYGIFPKVE